MKPAGDTLQRPSLWELLQEIPDHRRREGRIYPLASVLGLLIVAGVNGESSLRGKWLWGREHWRRLWKPLGFKPGSAAPQYGTLWTILDGLDEMVLERVLQRWSAAYTTAETEAISIDGKYLRGSKRIGQPALQVVSALAQEVGQFVGQVAVQDGDSVAAALDVLRGIPLEGKVVTMDAGLLQKSVAEVILAKGGAYLGVLKGNHGEVTPAVAYWVENCLETAPPDTTELTKRHGRIELREYWWIAAGELAAYVAKMYGWPAVVRCGRVRRRWRSSCETTWTHDETSYVILGSRREVLPPPDACTRYLRQHWAIENRGFWVLDVTYGEDRNHARKIALPLTKLRQTAINLIRQQGFRFSPDGQRRAAARTDRGLAWLF